MKKRILSLITALALCLSLCPVGALAAEGRTGGTGGTGAPSVTPADPDPTATLSENINLNDIYAIEFKPSYQANFSNLQYGNTSSYVAAPTPNDLIFWVNGVAYLKPADDTKLSVALTGIDWGNSNMGGTLPLNAGTYTLTASVTLTKVEQPTPSPSAAPSPTPSGPDTPSGNTRDGDGPTTRTIACHQMPFAIQQRELTPEISGTAFTKQYDGSTAYTLPVGQSTPIQFTQGLLGGDQLTVKADFSFSNASVGSGYTVYARNITLEGEKAINYTLTARECEKANAGTVTKATMHETLPTNRIVLRNRRANTYSFDLSKLLPTLPNGQEYNNSPEKENVYGLGAIKINYQAFFEMKPDGITPADDVFKIDKGKLYITTKSAAYDNPIDNVGTIEVNVVTDNFKPFACTITMSSANKTQVHIGGLTPVNPDYNGEEQIGYLGPLTFSLADTTEGDADLGLTKENVRFSYQSSSRSPVKYGPSEVPPKEPGNYEVTVTIDENNPDYVASEFFVFNINKAKIKVIAKDRTIRIDDPVPEFSKPQLGVDYDVVGVAEGDELRLPPTMKYATVADSIMEGEFDILIDGAMVPDNDHYDPAIEYVPGKLKVTSMTAEQENPFSDVSEYTWYVTAVKYVYNKGMMNGVSATLFDPMGDLTRGMLVTILYRMDGERPVWATMPFTDLDPNGYYLNAVRWASSNQIVNGYGDGRFGPNDPLTREQMAIILYNYTRYKGITPNKAASLDHFVDALDTSATGYRALQWACAEKLIQGTGSTTLSPHDKALRAQVAVVLMRYGTLYPNLVPKDKTDTSSTT